MASLQYKVEHVARKPAGKIDGFAQSIETKVNEYGYHGWRLVATLPATQGGTIAGAILTFEREAPAES